MEIRWVVGGFAASLVVAGAVGLSIPKSSPSRTTTVPTQARVWTERSLQGNAVIRGEVPLSLTNGKASYVKPHPANARLRVNFGYPLADKAGLDALIAQESQSHRYISRDDLYSRFSPPTRQVGALESWLKSHGFTVTHTGADRMALTATATTAQVERALHIKINDYVRQGYAWNGIKVKPYVFYANTGNPTLPARLGIQTVSGLTSIDRFFTSAQMARASSSPPIVAPPQQKNLRGDADVRSGGYFPSDLRSMYDVTGHGFDGSGQTVGFTLWGAGERQAAMTAVREPHRRPAHHRRSRLRRRRHHADHAGLVHEPAGRAPTTW